MQFTLALLLTTAAAPFVAAGPAPVAETYSAAEPENLLVKRITCPWGMVPTCCNTVTWYSYPPPPRPGISYGCVKVPSSGVCPSTSSTLACCRKAVFTNDPQIDPNGNSYCLVP